MNRLTRRPALPFAARSLSGCDRYRPALMALAVSSDRIVHPVEPAALEHLARCRACEAEIARALEARVALQRLWQQSPRQEQPLEPAADSWPRLRARIERRPRRATRAASSVLGLALGAGLSVALLVPVVVQRPAPEAITESGINQDALLAADRVDATAEARWLRSTAQAGKEAPLPVQTRARTRSDLARYAETPVEQPANRAPRAQATSVE